MHFKGQSSVELTLVISLALVLASPFILASQSSVIQLNLASDFLQLDNSMDKVEEVSSSLNADSYPARKKIRFSTPRTVEKVYNPHFPAENTSALVFQLNSRGQPTNESILFDYNLTLDNPEELAEQGNHEVMLRRKSDSINMSVIS